MHKNTTTADENHAQYSMVLEGPAYARIPSADRLNDYDISTRTSSSGGWKVVTWVRDVDLESKLNELHNNFWDVIHMFRNAPGADHLETTTLVAKKINF